MYSDQNEEGAYPTVVRLAVRACFRAGTSEFGVVGAARAVHPEPQRYHRAILDGLVKKPKVRRQLVVQSVQILRRSIVRLVEYQNRTHTHNYAEQSTVSISLKSLLESATCCARNYTHESRRVLWNRSNDHGALVFEPGEPHLFLNCVLIFSAISSTVADLTYNVIK